MKKPIGIIALACLCTLAFVSVSSSYVICDSASSECLCNCSSSDIPVEFLGKVYDQRGGQIDESGLACDLTPQEMKKFLEECESLYLRTCKQYCIDNDDDKYRMCVDAERTNIHQRRCGRYY